MATSTEAAANLDEWTESGPVSTRTAKKKRFLHRMLDQLDKEDEESKNVNGSS